MAGLSPRQDVEYVLRARDETGPTVRKATEGMKGAFKGAREALGESSVFGQSMKLLTGAGLAAGFTVALREMTRIADEATRMTQAFQDGKVTLTEMAGEIARTLPVMGTVVNFWEAVTELGLTAVGKGARRRFGFETKAEIAQQRKEEQDWFNAENERLRRLRQEEQAERKRQADIGTAYYKAEDLRRSIYETLVAVGAERTRAEREAQQQLTGMANQAQIEAWIRTRELRNQAEMAALSGAAGILPRAGETMIMRQALEAQIAARMGGADPETMQLLRAGFGFQLASARAAMMQGANTAPATWNRFSREDVTGKSDEEKQSDTLRQILEEGARTNSLLDAALTVLRQMESSGGGLPLSG